VTRRDFRALARAQCARLKKMGDLIGGKKQGDLSPMLFVVTEFRVNFRQTFFRQSASVEFSGLDHRQ
jgi:hypothetical protein